MEIKTEYSNRDGWSATTIIDLLDETKEGYLIMTRKDFRGKLTSSVQKVGFAPGSQFQALIPPIETKSLASNLVKRLTETILHVQHEQAVKDWLEAIKHGESLESGLNGSHLK